MWCCKARRKHRVLLNLKVFLKSPNSGQVLETWLIYKLSPWIFIHETSSRDYRLHLIVSSSLIRLIFCCCGVLIVVVRAQFIVFAFAIVPSCLESRSCLVWFFLVVSYWYLNDALASLCLRASWVWHHNTLLNKHLIYPNNAGLQSSFEGIQLFSEPRGSSFHHSSASPEKSGDKRCSSQVANWCWLSIYFELAFLM